MPSKKKSQGKTPEIVLDEKTHRYTVDGERKPSVTTIVNVVEKYALTKWKIEQAVDHALMNIPDFISGEREYSLEVMEKLFAECIAIPGNIAGDAAMHGTAIHKLLERYLREGRKPRANTPKVKRDLDGFARWKNRHDVIPEALEEVFYHAALDYCCRPDFLGVLDDKRAVLDWKTGGFHPEPVGMQLAGNAAAIENATDTPVETIAAIHIDDRGLPHWKDFTDERERYWQKFKALLDYWKL